MRQEWVGAVLAAIATVGGVTAQAQAESSSLRPEDAAIRVLIGRGLERSATFRELNTRLDASDVIVYIRSSRCAGGVAACLAWASTCAGARRLMISLDRFGHSPDELTALLAHELQHANEVASSSDITDFASFEKSFRSRGWNHGAGFETGEAKRIAKLVAAELRRGR